ncbi:DUF5056 domain-containing protein [Facilibium subflavum]|uniref:DUF5056 domain-containing protein n=1 Tax=Facilibium subflavum TaxID=2219058 RepID=UPI000E6487C7|nr:DUF5056 domain-containing protein [Facilibium subflavum]
MNDQDLKKLFDQCENTIEDNGFSEKILQQLPKKPHYPRWAMWLNICISIIITSFALMASAKHFYSIAISKLTMHTSLLLVGITLGCLFIYDVIFNNDH